MKFTEEYIKDWLLENRSDIFIVGKYIEYNTKTDFCFSKCGHTPRASFCGIKTNIKCAICDGKQVDKSNSLRTFFPQFALEFHPRKNNGLTPDTVAKTSNKQIWWLCNVCSHEWASQPCKRAIGQGGYRSCYEGLQRTQKSAGAQYPYLKDICDFSEDADICVIGPSSEKVLNWTCDQCGDKTKKSVVRNQDA